MKNCIPFAPKSASIFFLTILISIFSYTSFAQEALVLVPTEKVCMVTNMVFPRPQIPVEVKGKTYYGCCENCKKTLSEDAQARQAVDPVTGKKIDKATAQIAARSDGSVVYFESKKTFEQFNKKNSKTN